MAGAVNTIEESDVAALDAAATPPKTSKKLLIIIIALVLAGLAGGGGYWYFTQKSTSSAKAGAGHGEAASEESGHGAASEHGATKGSANYLLLEPSFVVNLSDTEAMRYLQVDVQVMSRDPQVLEDAKQQMPRIRNSLLLLFGQQHAFDISSREGKEALQAKALAEVQRVLKEETGKPGIQAVYFTSFVMQ